jgi:hypothetical protein
VKKEESNLGGNKSKRDYSSDMVAEVSKTPVNNSFQN